MPELNRTPNTKCCICGNDTYIRPYRLKRLARIGFTCSRSCSSELKKEKYKSDNNPKWRGGTTNDHGYLLIYSKDHPRKTKSCYALAHHLIMEESIGRFLKYISKGHKDNEVVHHIDGDKANNQLENLSLMTTQSHNELHRTFFDKHVRKLIQLGKIKWNESIKDYEVME
jgi:hypothetical protein